MLPYDIRYSRYLELLKTELVPAMGCTEPVAVAYAAARAREILGEMPDRALVEVSGNIVKNVKSVTAPNTGGLKGLKAAAGAGIAYLQGGPHGRNFAYPGKRPGHYLRHRLRRRETFLRGKNRGGG
jgi:hypothetical protein